MKKQEYKLKAYLSRGDEIIRDYTIQIAHEAKISY